MRTSAAQLIPIAAVTASLVCTAPAFAQSPLVRQGRLSVVRLDAAQWAFLTGGGRG